MEYGFNSIIKGAEKLLISYVALRCRSQMFGSIPSCSATTKLIHELYVSCALCRYYNANGGMLELRNRLQKSHHCSHPIIMINLETTAKNN